MHQGEFDSVYPAIKETINQVGVPKREREDSMAIIKSYRSMLVAPENRAA
ncbi:hypothetical protein FP2506_06376 [Fulvimarina pelagi HTCC2506]|uniref:Uncharacterized protein n=1 Tax=Fulvimarina pelagi HTCC2506 TaxID=314231 RepID=Q0G7C1_9HYPH|nr:hypothetical protein [Fulvimarina pelagi]EAU42443.1 hypothetical protein FP2506_06376 [Fulvimarina pelagi HTCC2506]